MKGPATVNEPGNIFVRLMEVIEDRKVNPSPRSYTNRLFRGGVEMIGDKIIEEAAEVEDAARQSDEKARVHLVHEAADLIYHLFVMLAHRGVRLADVEAELNRRFGISGLEEKEARKQAPPHIPEHPAS